MGADVGAGAAVAAGVGIDDIGTALILGDGPQGAFVQAVGALGA